MQPIIFLKSLYRLFHLLAGYVCANAPQFPFPCLGTGQKSTLQSAVSFSINRADEFDISMTYLFSSTREIFAKMSEFKL